ncbi:MAG: cytoplasmic protein [Desulfobacterales bacterium]|nr:cytoplasmic protein [Desulfobacterales bacterium]
MTEGNENETIDFTVDQDNLYREESYTDMKAGAVRRLVPVYPDGSEDRSRTPVFVGTTQILTPQGPLPIQAALQANTLKEALAAFPYSMQAALQQVLEELEQMQAQTQEKEDSRIIIPGRE